MSDRMSVEIDGHGAGIHFSAAHFLVDVDKCERVHGHNYILSARVEGRLDSTGMVIDFSEVKRVLREIAETMDHHVLVPGDGILAVEVDGDEVRMEHKGRRYVLPTRDVVVLDVPAITAENLAASILRQFRSMLDADNVFSLPIGIEEAPGQTAWVHSGTGGPDDR